MIMFTGPYRNAIKKWLFKLKIIQIIVAIFRKGNLQNQVEPTKTQHPQQQQQPEGIQMEIVKKLSIAIITAMPLPMMVNGVSMANPVEAIAAAADSNEVRKKSSAISIISRHKFLTKVE
jgi:hypothetical protein